MDPMVQVIRLSEENGALRLLLGQQQHEIERLSKIIADFHASPAQVRAPASASAQAPAPAQAAGSGRGCGGGRGGRGGGDGCGGRGGGVRVRRGSWSGVTSKVCVSVLKAEPCIAKWRCTMIHDSATVCTMECHYSDENCWYFTEGKGCAFRHGGVIGNGSFTREKVEAFWATRNAKSGSTGASCGHGRGGGGRGGDSGRGSGRGGGGGRADDHTQSMATAETVLAGGKLSWADAEEAADKK